MESNDFADPITETSLIAGIYSNGGDAFLDVADIITSPDCFQFEINQALWGCYRFIFEADPKAEIDLPTLLSAADRLGFTKTLSKPSAKSHLRAITNMPVKLSNVRRFAAELQKLRIRKQLLSLTGDIQEELRRAPKGSAIEHLLGLVENPIFDFVGMLSANQNEIQQIGDGVDGYLDHVESNPCEMVGISSGYRYLDKAIGGLRRRTVNMIGARPKVGKSQLADNISLFVSGKLSLPCLELDTEMATEDHWNRCLANLSGIPIDDIETGKYSRSSSLRQKVRAAAAYLKTIPFDYCSISGQPFEETLGLMRRWVTKKVGRDEGGRTKDCLVVLDYFKLMSSESISDSMKEYQVLGFMATAFASFVHRYDLPAVAFIQLTRDGITKTTSDVASGSDRVVWLCSNFSIFKPKDEEEIAEESVDHIDRGNRKLIPVLQRHGEGLNDGDWINMKFEGKFGRVTELGLRSGMKKDEGFEATDDLGDDPFGE